MHLAADTNVLVRLLVSDDLAQQAAVVARLEEAESAGGKVLVTSVVLAELSWVLESAYEYDRKDIVRAIEAVMTTSPFSIEDPPVATAALDAFRTGSAGFSDYLVLAAARARGASRLLTFDRKLLRHPDCEKP